MPFEEIFSDAEETALFLSFTWITGFLKYPWTDKNQLLYLSHFMDDSFLGKKREFNIELIRLSLKKDAIPTSEVHKHSSHLPR